MLSNVSVLLPYKPDNGIRDKLFKWVVTFYKQVMPAAQVCIGENHDDLFNRSKALNNAAKHATKDVFVIADSDVIYKPDIILQSLPLLEQHAWVIPYSRWLDLSRKSSIKLLKTTPAWPLAIETDYTDRYKRKDRKPNPVSGVIVIPRDHYYDAGGFDERFQGWGREDRAFSLAMNTLCGPFYRIEEGSIYHLWHKRLNAKNNPNYHHNDRLYERYVESNGDVLKMRALTQER